MLLVFSRAAVAEQLIEGPPLYDLVRVAAERRGEIHHCYTLGNRLLVLCTRAVPDKSVVLGRPFHPGTADHYRGGVPRTCPLSMRGCCEDFLLGIPGASP